MIQSHTATQQWQSFEMKMRRRRLERCLLRASVALDAGVLEDAAEALEEAARLDPNDPSVPELAARLSAAQAHPSTADASPLLTAPAAEVPIRPIEPPVLADVPPAHSRVLAAVLAIALIALSGLGGWWWTISRSAAARPAGATAPPETGTSAATRPPSRPADPSVRISETAVTVPTVTAEPPADRDTAPVAPAAGAAPGAAVATTGSPATQTVAAAVPRVPDPRTVSRTESAPATNPRAETAAPPTQYTAKPLLTANPGEARVTPAPTLPPAPAPPPAAAPAPAANIVPATEGIGAAPDGAIKIAAPPVPEPAAAPAAAADEQNIRGVLGRYEAAYSRLDAAAASAVWPGVNQRALASAFQGLESQSISLGRCDVRVIGATAQAQCSGSARWTPKVGGGAQSASRQWRFDLRNTGGNWVITQATTR